LARRRRKIQRKRTVKKIRQRYYFLIQTPQQAITFPTDWVIGSSCECHCRYYLMSRIVVIILLCLCATANFSLLGQHIPPCIKHPSTQSILVSANTMFVHYWTQNRERSRLRACAKRSHQHCFGSRVTICRNSSILSICC